ncbi:MAG: UDP-N-acetylmuramate dehydrogenase [Candidatus Neomarinimicrobiota bacterium]|nr:MAG: UDP-N-acetylmuramate dehydrogenase [Candidatus Neomarinimicrobiota bacterium]
MIIREHVSLKDSNTFGIETSARYVAEPASPEDIETTLQNDRLAPLPKLVLGAGSNLLFTQPFEGLVLRPRFRQFTIREEAGERVFLTLGSGLSWHETVRATLDRGLFGLENLALIPGTVGAAPVQNIGAYGVELREVFHSLEAVNLRTGEFRQFDRDACQFGYRSSLFKSQPDTWLILSVTLALSRTFRPRLEYPGLEEELRRAGQAQPTARDVFDAVIRLRRRKLPDPAVLGSAGSFFKNPVLPADRFHILQQKWSDLKGYPTAPGQVKISAAQLIERAGWKGKSVGRAGVYEKHALVLVNLGGATGREIADLSQRIREDVQHKFGILLEPEVRIL